MKKIKLLFAALLAVGAWGNAYAGVDWTDKTSLINNPSFEADEAIVDLKGCGWATDRVTGWTITPASASNAQIGVGNSSSTLQGIGTTFTPSAGEKFFYTRNNWNSSTTFTLSQTISSASLPAGLYKLTCKTATYSSNAAFNTLTLSLQEGTNTPVANSGIVMNVWNTWGVILFKQADATDLTITMTFKPGYDGSNKHYAVVLDDFQLEFISAADAYSASAGNTIDFSAFINNSIIYNHSTKGNCPRGWTASKHTTGNGNYTEGENGDTRLEGWSGSNLDIDYNQTINYLPAGTYTVTAAAQERAAVGRTYVYASTEGQDDATGLVNSGTESDITTSELKVTNGTMKIGIRSTANDWVTADNFRISFLGFDVDAVKEEYETTYTAATNAKNDDAYDNVTGDERSNLEDAITTYTTDKTQNYGWYVTAKGALETATNAFTAAKDSYDALVAMRTTGGTYTTVAWPRASAAKMTALDNAIAAVPTNATDAVTKTNAIVTAYRQFVESNGLAEGVASAWDYTNTYLASADPEVNTGWTNGIGTDNRSEEKYTKGDGTQSGKYYDGGWSTSAAVNINMTRELTLPAGQYQLQITARGSAKLTSYTMSIGGETVNLPYEGADVAAGTFGHGWSDKFVVFNSDGSTPLTLAIVATSTDFQQWISFNRLRLMRLDAMLANATDYTNLQIAIDDAEDKTLGFENGEYAPYNNVAALAALAQAQAIDQDEDNDQDVVQAVTAALSGATWTANDGGVECVYNGDFAEGQGSDAANIQQYGWTRTNAWGQFRDDVYGGTTGYYNQPGSLQYGNAGNYTMPLKENTVYRLQFKYGAWDQTVTPTVSVLNSTDGMAAMSFASTSTKYDASMTSVDMVFVTGAAGNYVLTIAGDKNLVVTGVSIMKAASQVLEFADGSVPSYAPGTYPTVKITRTLIANRWATAVYPFAVSGVDDIAVLDSYDAESGALGFTSALASTANVPFLMRSTSGTAEISLNGVEVAAATATDATAKEASLKGVYSSTDITNEEKNYVLSNNTIYPVGTAGATINPYRAYIQIAEGSSVKALTFFVDDEATSIDAINGVEAENGAIYNIAGQRLNKAQKGINIVNGKKVLF